MNQGLATLAFFGVNVNLVLFLTRVLGQSNGDAANNVSKWTGTVYMFSLIGAFLSDSYWGRYKTCAIFQAIFVLVSRTRIYMYIRRPANLPISVCRKEFSRCQRRRTALYTGSPLFLLLSVPKLLLHDSLVPVMYTCKQTHMFFVCTYNTKATIIRIKHAQYPFRSSAWTAEVDGS